MYTVVHAIVGYFYLLLTVRVLKRRPGSQMTRFEFVIIFLIGGVIILTTVGDDRSEINSVCAVLTVGLMHRLVSWLAERYPKIEAVVYGVPLVLLKDDQWQTDIMNRLHVQETDVVAAARTKGIKTAGEIKYAVLERNGGISVISK
jgi:uncharacterized membrane protein YcaP (DUF421 family)